MKKYWKSIEELQGKEVKPAEVMPSEDKNYILDLVQGDTAKVPASRRDFLKFCGFSLTAAVAAASCERPIQKAIPYLIKPEEITPGVASHYASTFYDGSEWCPVVVKVRDGRPIKMEGNELCRLTTGGTSARVQASVLTLYDNARYKGPLKGGKALNWKDADAEIISNLEKVAASGKKIVLLSPTMLSPSYREVFARFARKYPNTVHIPFDHSPASGILLANELSFGKKCIPSYQFDKASVIVSFAADFLGTWLMPVEFARQYAIRRNPDGLLPMSWHVQVESGLSLTGANADIRYPIRPSEEKSVLLAIHSKLTGKDAPETAFDITDLVNRLLENKGQSLIISSSNDIETQLLVNAINLNLGNYGSTLDFTGANLSRQAVDADFENLLRELNEGKIGALLVHGVNPAFLWPDKKAFAEGVKKADLYVSLASTPDETSVLAGFVCPDHHQLESWGDFQPYEGLTSLAQPVITPLFDTRQAQDSLLQWAGENINYQDLIHDSWSAVGDWPSMLQRGIIEAELKAEPVATMKAEALQLITGIQATKTSADTIELSLYENVGLASGYQSNNPWLQELPDPVSSVTWDNYAALSPKFAEDKGLITGDVILLNNLYELPVFIQPGQAYGTISVALHYGRTIAGKVAEGLGIDIQPLISIRKGLRNFDASGVSFTKIERKHEFAASQTHFNMEGRPIVRETSYEEYKKNPISGNEVHEEFEKNHHTLYPDVKVDGYNWGMTIDLNSCTGCSACVIACQSENNVAVVGKAQVKKRRIMHWIRIDRYYRGAPENPEVLYQPVMCQHCDNAPCENVCPVSATNHSHDGLNQMAYNRCIGTRYCVNNCPYKVRRFNWFRYIDNEEFDYNQNSSLGRMALNPDVTVRERGVVEKCSLCIQRIQEKKLLAKEENRVLADGELQTACMQACPPKAIVFGDLNNPESKVARGYQAKRLYHLLEELHTLPSVGYMTRVKNSKA
jgi:Fe-S-cluster-containing dehydrogenase component